MKYKDYTYFDGSWEKEFMRRYENGKWYWYETLLSKPIFKSKAYIFDEAVEEGVYIEKNNISDVIKELEDAIEKFNSLVGESVYSSVYYPVDSWCEVDNKLQYNSVGDGVPEDNEEYVYSENIIKMKELDSLGLTLLYIKNCFGEKEWLMLENKQRKV